MARSDGWLQPFELLTYDALRVAWASHARAPGYFWSTGTAIVGNIGTRKRLKYGAQGNMLNAGARLDGLTKTIGTRILVSADIVGKTRRHSFRPTGALVVKRSRWRNRGVRAD